MIHDVHVRSIQFLCIAFVTDIINPTYVLIVLQTELVLVCIIDGKVFYYYDIMTMNTPQDYLYTQCLVKTCREGR